MTVDPTPSTRPRPAGHARHPGDRGLAAVAAITIAACSSGTADEPTAASTSGVGRIDHAATRHERTREGRRVLR